jgi:SAM-dependent methyltransferase
MRSTQSDQERAMVSRYFNKAALDAEVEAGRHRDSVGLLWDEVGQLQADFLVSRGLMPHHRLLDIGCGCLRGGVKLVRYLDAGHYAGTDLHESLLKAGYEIELAKEGLTHKLPRSNLVADGEFDFSWCPMRFDFVLAQSVFTSLPLNFLRVCLERLPNFVVPEGKFFVSIFECPDRHPTHKPYRHPSGYTSHGAKEPYHYRFADMEFCCRALPWRAVNIGNWDHPLSVRMILFEKKGL